MTKLNRPIKLWTGRKVVIYFGILCYKSVLSSNSLPNPFVCEYFLTILKGKNFFSSTRSILMLLTHAKICRHVSQFRSPFRAKLLQGKRGASKVYTMHLSNSIFLMQEEFLKFLFLDLALEFCVKSFRSLPLLAIRQVGSALSS